MQIAAEQRAIQKANRAHTSFLSESVLRALIAVAEHIEDPFRAISIQTLSEICEQRANYSGRVIQTSPVLVDIELMAKCGGIRVLLHGLAEAPPEVTPLLASVFLYIIDSPDTRSYLQPGTDLEVIRLLYLRNSLLNIYRSHSRE